MGTPAISASAIARPVASPSARVGRVSAWYLGAVCPLRSASLTSVSITPPFSACMQMSPPLSRVLQQGPEDGGVVHHEHAGVGHEELEGGDALVLDHAVHVARDLVGQLAHDHVEARSR